MDIDRILLAVAVMIAATIVASSVAKKLSLGPTVALLVVGMALGPYSPRPLLTGHIDELRTAGEIGVILLLFLVGLDTQPKRLSSMRRLFFGLGTAQYFLTTAAIAWLLLVLAPIHWQAALIIALGLAMSSDAVAVSSLEEHAESASPVGRAVMAVEIYQDFLTIPVLAVIPLLAARSLPSGLAPTALKTLEVCAALTAVYLFARYALPKVLAFAARKQGIEVFNGTVVAAVFTAAWIMDTVGLSSALGAFMVGMILSASVFAPQIKASVSPLKGLLLGVFFMAIGMSIDLKEVVALGGPLLYYLLMFLLTKIAIVVVLCLGFRLGFRTSLLAGLLLAPFDEIAYIIFSSAHSSGLLTDRVYAMGLIMISLSFVVSPVLINLGYKLAERFPAEPKPGQPLKAPSESTHDHVVVVGYSYVGRVICMMLERASIPYVAFELKHDRLAEAKKERHKVYYGDVTDPATMDALAIARARAVIVTTRDYSAVKLITGTLRQFYPSVKVMTAVTYLFQREELRKMGATQVVALTPEGTLSFGKSVLGELGVGPDDTETIISSLRADDYGRMRGVGGIIPEAREAAGEKG
ncbi:MAG TPA: cation:proton antiporter [Thermodesulfovibrionales bacterium]|nr:cation:proton antiporter [Thermodesulfovibrionales bacterium]